jgi:hypothetical protein
MSEGELVKSIFLEAFGKDYLERMRGRGSMVNTIIVRDVIDRVKVDFPNKPDPSILPDNETKRLWEWYIRWFGK